MLHTLSPNTVLRPVVTLGALVERHEVVPGRRIWIKDLAGRFVFANAAMAADAGGVILGKVDADLPWADRVIEYAAADAEALGGPLLLRERVRARTRRTSGESLQAIIAKLNPLLRGWFGYFKHAQARTLATLDAFVRRRLRSILCKREGRSYVYHRSRYNHQRWPNAFFAEQGLFTMRQARQQASQSR